MTIQMEAHRQAGVLSTISLTWSLNDIFHIQNHFLNNLKLQWMVVGIIFAAFCLCVGWLLLSVRVRLLLGNTDASNEEQKSLPSTFLVIPTIAGLLVGASSQFLLQALFVWIDKQHLTAMSHLLLFSMLWSLSTVFYATVGYLSLRFLVEDEQESSCNSCCNLDCLQRQRVISRILIYYVGSTLVGICIAYICMDIFLHTKEQILPSLGMLVVSLGAFRTVVHCFSEEKCLEEAREEESFLL
jgi:hypothetical protein